MKRTRLTSWLLFAGVLLLVAGIGLSESFLAQWRQLGGPNAQGKLTVNVDLAADPTGSAGLTIREAEKLAEKWGRPVHYSARAPAVATAGDTETEADAIGVGGSYDRFANVWLYRGGMITEKSIEEHSRVVMVSSGLAEQLFRTRDVVGMKLQLMGATFTVIGVYEQAESLLHRMTDNGKPDLLLPITTLIDLNASVKVATIELEAGPNAAISGETDVRSALSAIGKPPSRYRIVNLAAERSWVGQKPTLLLAAAGAAGLVLCARLAALRIGRAVRLIRRGLSVEDWPDVVKRYRRELSVDAAALLALSACAVLLWLSIRYRFYIPAELVPEEWIDGSFYRDKLLEWWRSEVAAMGYVASTSELLYAKVGLLVDRLTLVGFLVGLPLVWIGVREWAMVGLAPDRRIVRLAVYACGAVVLTAAIAALTGAEYAIRPRELFVVASLLGLAALSAPSPQTTFIRKKG
ncbi:ABC transporter permease [Paenibacillus sp. GYB003]|uniref:ABC transporter permease n=1 Tax=Paenibacillus sp. GYB003 TaxID=2994392 RepID=UPI002F96B2D5